MRKSTVPAAAICLALVLLAACASDDATQTIAGAGAASRSPAVDEEPVAEDESPATLSDELLADVAATPVFENDVIVLIGATSSTSTDAGVCVRVEHKGTTRGGSLCADPRVVDDVLLGASSETATSPSEERRHYGVTRGSVVRLVATTEDGTELELDVVHDDAFPALAWFTFEDIGPIRSVEGFDAEGELVAAASQQTLSYTGASTTNAG